LSFTAKVLAFLCKPGQELLELAVSSSSAFSLGASEISIPLNRLIERRIADAVLAVQIACRHFDSVLL
jgi:hypothetical protein